MEISMTRTMLLALAVAALGAAGPASAAKAPVQGGQCFLSGDVTNWRAVGDRQVNLEVRTREVYRLDLGFECPQLRFAAETIGITARGAGLFVCESSLADIVVPGQGGITCPVTRSWAPTAKTRSMARTRQTSESCGWPTPSSPFSAARSKATAPRRLQECLRSHSDLAAASPGTTATGSHHPSAANRAAAVAGSLTTVTLPGSWPCAASDSTTSRRSVALPTSNPPVSRSG